MVLDGSSSHDDIAIESSEWRQDSGPRPAVFADKDALKTNVTGLTKGKYKWVTNNSSCHFVEQSSCCSFFKEKPLLF